MEKKTVIEAEFKDIDTDGGETAIKQNHAVRAMQATSDFATVIGDKMMAATAAVIDDSLVRSAKKTSSYRKVAAFSLMVCLGTTISVIFQNLLGL